MSDVLLSRFQTLGLDLTLRPRTRSLTATQRAELTAPVYNRHDLSVETSVAIEEYARLLSDVPGLAPEALIVFECAEDETPDVGGLDVLDTRDYGAAKVLFLRAP